MIGAMSAAGPAGSGHDGHDPTADSQQTQRADDYVRIRPASLRATAYIWTMTTYSAVVTTGIYCRPGCGAKPLAKNTRTFELAAAAEAAGFRACLRCRPYRVASPVDARAPEM